MILTECVFTFFFPLIYLDSILKINILKEIIWFDFFFCCMFIKFCNHLHYFSPTSGGFICYFFTSLWIWKFRSFIFQHFFSFNIFIQSHVFYSNTSLDSCPKILSVQNIFWSPFQFINFILVREYLMNNCKSFYILSILCLESFYS